MLCALYSKKLDNRAPDEGKIANKLRIYHFKMSEVKNLPRHK